MLCRSNQKKREIFRYVCRSMNKEDQSLYILQINTSHAASCNFSTSSYITVPKRRLTLCHLQSASFSLLTPALGSATALHPLSGRPIDMMRRDPTLIVSLRTRCHGWSISANDRNLISWVYFLASQRPLGPLASFTSAALLGKESGDPGAVNEVACPPKGKTKE